MRGYFDLQEPLFMRRAIARIAVVLIVVSFQPLFAEQPDKPITSVPRLVRVSGIFHPANGLPAGNTESATLSIYKEEQGGQPLWQETQNVAIDASGQYTALLGLTQEDGVPLDLFSSAEPRWLGVQFNRPGETEQPRVQLVSVPYALKASDAETLGGKPASAYLLDPNAATTNTADSGTTTTSLPNPKLLKPRAISGTINYLPYFTDNSGDLGNSVVYQGGTSIGIDTTNFSAYGQTAALAVNGYASIGGLRLNGSDPFNTIYSGSGIAMEAGGNSIMLNPSGGSVGIGSSNFSAYGQTATLAVNGYANIGGLRLNGGDTLNTIYSGSPIAMSAGGNSISLNASGGNVGIGTATPGSKLDVAGNINFSGALSYQARPILGMPGGSGNFNTAVGLSALSSNTTAAANTAVGYGALAANATAFYNTAIGYMALSSNNAAGNTATGFTALVSNTTGASNTAVGSEALSANMTGGDNTATGYTALANNTSGYNNTATGMQALYSNTTGGSNTATGMEALYSNVNGSSNTATGISALFFNTSGSYNTATGNTALASNTTGTDNTATGYDALNANNSGSYNTATGVFALTANTASNNTAMGYNALAANTTGYDNTAVGINALAANTTGYNNIAIGQSAGQFVDTGNSNNVHIGTGGEAGDSNTIRIGNFGTQTAFFAAGIAGATVSGVNVLVNTATGQLGVASSSRRYKEDIQDMGDASSGLMRLRPVTFRYQKPFADGSKSLQYGLIAEEVAEVYPDLVAHSADGQIETVKYQLLDPMLLNEVQRLNRENQDLKERVSRLEEAISRLAGAAAVQ
jgi:trimeric autotransporter adhesin